MPSDVKPPVDDLVAVLESAIVWGYNLLQRISCGNGIVSNWWSLPQGDVWPWAHEPKRGLQCHNSATAAGEYGADAVRIPWRVTLDYIWFAKETTRVPLYDDNGWQIGIFGAKEYANRWAQGVLIAIPLMTSPYNALPHPTNDLLTMRVATRCTQAWKRAIVTPSGNGEPIQAGAFPPRRADVKRLRPDQVAYGPLSTAPYPSFSLDHPTNDRSS